MRSDFPPATPFADDDLRKALQDSILFVAFRNDQPQQIEANGDTGDGLRGALVVYGIKHHKFQRS